MTNWSVRCVRRMRGGVLFLLASAGGDPARQEKSLLTKAQLASAPQLWTDDTFRVVGFMDFVCWTAAEAPSKFGSIPAKMKRRSIRSCCLIFAARERTLRHRRCSRGRRLLKIFLWRKCFVTECDWRLSFWQILSGQRCG